MAMDYSFTDNKTNTVAKTLKQQASHKADAQRRLLDDNPAAYIGRHTITGHAYESHVAVSDRQILDNVLSQNKIGDTVYSSPDMEQYCTSEILYANMERIQEFAGSAMPGTKQAYFAEFTDPDTGDPMYVGRGFVSDADDKHKIYSQGRPIRSIDTSIAAVVVRANPDAADGWEITTSFPASHPDLEPQDKNAILDRKEDITGLMHLTDTYRHADPVKRAYMDTAFAGKTPDGLAMSYQGYRGATQPPRLQIAMEHEPYRPVARVIHNPGAPEGRVKFVGNINRVQPEVWSFAHDMKDRIDVNIEDARHTEKTLPKANTPIREAVSQENAPPDRPGPSTAIKPAGRDTGRLPGFDTDGPSGPQGRPEFQ